MWQTDLCLHCYISVKPLTCVNHLFTIWYVLFNKMSQDVPILTSFLSAKSQCKIKLCKIELENGYIIIYRPLIRVWVALRPTHMYTIIPICSYPNIHTHPQFLKIIFYQNMMVVTPPILWVYIACPMQYT